MITTPRASIVIEDGDLRRDLAAFFDDVKNPVALAKVLGRELANLIREHLRAKDKAEPNKLGGQRTHFWLAVSRSVQQPELESDGVSVAISDPRFAQRLFGGGITPKKAKQLTIPLIAKAHGRRVSVFVAETAIRLFRIGIEGKQFLAYRDESDRVVAAYALRMFVDQKPDPTALPSDETIIQRLLDRATAYVARKKRELKLNE